MADSDFDEQENPDDEIHDEDEDDDSRRRRAKAPQVRQWLLVIFSLYASRDITRRLY